MCRKVEIYRICYEMIFNDNLYYRHAFNWPNIPETKVDSDRNAIYLSILMLYTKCFNDCLSTVENERK